MISLALTMAVRKSSPSCKFGPSCVASEGTKNGGLNLIDSHRNSELASTEWLQVVMLFH